MNSLRFSSPLLSPESPSGGEPGRNGEPTPVAQLVEQRIPNPQVAGSSPSRRVDESSPENHIQFGLRRYGQGYWVRVMTAVFAGMLVLGFAFWLSELTQLIELPKSSWRLGLANMSGDLAPGTLVTLSDNATPPADVATGVVQNVSSRAGTSGAAVIGQIKQVPGRYITDSTLISWSGSGILYSAAIGSQVGIPIFNPIYISRASAILVIIAGAILVYWLVGRHSKFVDFLVAVDGEMKKVNWSTKRIIQNSTTVVILASFLIAGALFVIDYIFARFFQLIDVMPK
jgi:preprotein translocase SecE subunit